jgi:acetyl esterase/lipase
MTAPTTALLVLLDTKPGSTQRTVPFNSGLTTTKGDVAVLITAGGVKVADLATGAVSDLAGSDVAYDPSGYNNSIEARLPESVLQDATQPGIAVAAGLDGGNGALKALGDSTTNPQGVNVANVAFRPNEPAREWWDRQQGLELYKKTMDAFFTTADISRMDDGANERYVPGTGYHEALFTSTTDVSDENNWAHGLTQRYGVYLPTRYDEERPTPTQFWFHFRGGSAHVAAQVVPGVFWDMGEGENSIVITPDGRGTSGWYVGKSGVDVQQVWDDSHRRFNIDRNRTYISGHSMGGWASWLLPVMHPDWFAASLPASPPPTQGAWVGFTDDQIPNCGDYTYDDYSPCFVEANGGDAKAEWTYPLLDNLREVPIVVYHGNEDELVPATGVTLMMKKLQDLGYRYRYYLFEGQEHYGPPAIDQWQEGAEYMHKFERNPNPQQVTYIRSMVFENAIERVNTDGMPAKPDFDLSHDFWMSGLEAVDAVKGIARFDGESLGLPKVPHTLEPEADTAPKKGNAAPYVMAGQRWIDDPSQASATSNAFKITLTGAKAVTLDLDRMKLSLNKPLAGDITTDHELTLTLHTDFGPDKVVTVPAGHQTTTF